MSKKEEVKRGLTAKSFLTGIILVIFWSLLGSFVWGTTGGYVPGEAYWTQPFEISAVTFFMIFILVIITPALKERGFTSNELTVIYVMLLSSLFVSVSWVTYTIGPLTNARIWAEWDKYFFGPPPAPPELWVPLRDVCTPMRTGGAIVPWSEWTIPIAFWIVFTLSIVGVCTSFNLILSRRIIEEEALPFPFLSVITRFTEEPSRSIKRMPGFGTFLVGALIGFVIQFSQGLLYALFPAIKQMWPQQVWGWIGLDLGPLYKGFGWNIVAWFPLMHFPLYFALYCFVPTDVTLTSIIAYIFWYVIGLPQIEILTGKGSFPTPFSLTNGFGMSFGRTTYFGGTRDWIDGQIATGFVVGLAVWRLFLARRSIAASLKSFVKGGRAGYFSDRILWGVLIISLIMHTATIMTGLIPWYSALALILFVVLFNYVNLLVRAESVGAPSSQGLGLIARRLHLWGFYLAGGATAVETPQTWNAALIADSQYGHGVIWSPALSIGVVEGLKLCEITKTRKKDVAIAAVIACVVGVLIGYPLYVWGAYTYGYDYGWIAKWTIEAGREKCVDAYNVQHPRWAGVGYTKGLVESLIIGIVVIILVSIVQLRFPGLPINAVGIPIGVSYLFSGYVWFASLLALLTRLLVLKVGGTRLYEGKLVPLAVGLFVGWAIDIFILGLVVASWSF